MAKHVQLKVTDPCHENWEAMIPVEKGRFCNACQKQVVDFTGMSDTQLAAFFKKPSTGSLCGRFMQDQLNRDIPIPRKRIPWLSYVFRFAIPAALISCKTAAQEPSRLTGAIAVAPVTKDKVNQSKEERIITGRIMDEEENGIGHATVLIADSTAGTTTDSLGNFRLAYQGPEKKIILTISCIGYEEKRQVVRLGKRPGSIRTIELTLEPARLEDVIIVGGYATVFHK